jgi:hypothetical protein
MCGSKPKTPKVQDIPIRAAAMLPDNGDPSVRLGLRVKRSLTTAASVLAARAGGGIGAPPTVSSPTPGAVGVT